MSGTGPQGDGGQPLPTDVPPAAPVGPVAAEPRPAPVKSSIQERGIEILFVLLGILTASIVILFLYLGILDYSGSQRVQQVYDGAVRSATLATALPEVNALDSAAAVLRQLAKEPQGSVAAPEREAAAAVLERLGRSDAPEAGVLAGCAPPLKAAAAVEVAVARRCADALGRARAALPGVLGVDALRELKGLAKDLQDHHQGLRTFWISAAQLVLVNVLLPLLTALLGYIFGREATQK